MNRREFAKAATALCVVPSFANPLLGRSSSELISTEAVADLITDKPQSSIIVYLLRDDKCYNAVSYDRLCKSFNGYFGEKLGFGFKRYSPNGGFERGGVFVALKKIYVLSIKRPIGPIEGAVQRIPGHWQYFQNFNSNSAAYKRCMKFHYTHCVDVRSCVVVVSGEVLHAR